MMTLAALQVQIETTQAERNLDRTKGKFPQMEKAAKVFVKETQSSFKTLIASIRESDRGFQGLITRMNAATTAANRFNRAMQGVARNSGAMSNLGATSKSTVAAQATFAGSAATFSNNFAPTAVPAPVITSFSSLGTAAATAGANVNMVTNSVRQIPQATAPASRSIIGLTGNIVGFYAAYKAATETVGAFGGFEKELSNIRALTGATEQEMRLLEETARQVGPDMYFNATQAAQGMTELAAAGLKVNQIMLASRDALTFAAAGQISVAEAADIGVKTLAQFDMQAGEMARVADVISKASDISRAKISMLGESLKMVGTNASVLGVSLEETVAALSVLTQAGLDGTLAGTGLRATIDALLDPSKEATEMLRLYGVSVEDLNVKMHGLTNVLETLRKIPTTEFGKLFDTRALTAASIATRDLDRIKEYNRQVSDARGHTAKMASIKMDNLVGEWTRLKNIMHEIALDVGREGGLGNALRASIKGVGDALIWLDKNFNAIAVSAVQTWNTIADAIDTTGTVILQMALEGGRILTNMFLGVKTTVETIFTFISTTVGKLMSYVTATIAKTLEGIEKLVDYFPSLTESMIGTKGVAGLKEMRATFQGMTKELDKNPFKAAFDEAAKGAAAIENVEQNYRNLTEALAEGNAERKAARAASLRTAGGLLEMPEFPALEQRGGLVDTGRTPFEEPAKIKAPFDRFNTASKTVDGLVFRIRELKSQLNDEEWISEATEEDFQTAMEEMGAMSDALTRRFEANSVKWNRAMQIGFQETVDSYGTLSQRMASVGSGIAESLDTNFTNAFHGMIMGTMTVQEAFSNMATSIISDLVRIMVQQLIVRSILQSFGMFGGGASGTMAGDTFATSNVAGIAHDGGIAGEQSSFRRNAGSFNMARKYHRGGVAGDEVKIVAKRGERILTENQQVAGQKGGRPLYIVNLIDDPSVARSMERNSGTIVNVIGTNRRVVQAKLDGN